MNIRVILVLSKKKKEKAKETATVRCAILSSNSLSVCILSSGESLDQYLHRSETFISVKCYNTFLP